MLAGIKFVDRSEAERALEEEIKALRKQKKKEKKVRTSSLLIRHLHVSRVFSSQDTFLRTQQTSSPLCA